MHDDIKQSLLVLHVEPTGQGAQLGPPQSTSVSSMSATRLKQGSTFSFSFGFSGSTTWISKSGVIVGSCVGLGVGLSDGAAVGFAEGDDVGNDVGKSVGLFVGESVGLVVGKSVGLDVGKSVGLVVGESVGLVVGKFVGSGVGAGAQAFVSEQNPLLQSSLTMQSSS